MQTFLPYPDFDKTVKCLDYRRLGKQRVEGKQIYNILTGKATSNAWKNHPAVLMWHGHVDFLASYVNQCIVEWINRGYNNTMDLLPCKSIIDDYPFWFGLEQFHASHRSNLLRKNYDFYSRYGWSESVDLPYYWPVKAR